MANKHVKRCLTSLVIWEIQIKKKIRHHYNLLEWLKSHKLKMANAGEDAEQLELLYIIVRDTK